ncbi:hypothetical protein [Flavobacterium sp. NKUCC04_CG]|uniref:hypothetical protein n=1 Tax=Flavobacterium sp. NKUCC04_CG TaxID=2842121 RepID=UPI001C5AC731|nr:hypothetical protein [Flavobacterium sp. NKUCC04_CG]MBW3520333.1 hypothetical protein [Flavobacterium sp. NKUCC04_CG]
MKFFIIAGMLLINFAVPKFESVLNRNVNTIKNKNMCAKNKENPVFINTGKSCYLSQVNTTDEKI